MTDEGLAALSEKLAPLIQAGRLHNIVDLLSLVSDQIEFIDSEAAEKLSNSFEQSVSAFWLAKNSLRMAAAQVEQKDKPPGMLQLLKSFNDEDVRRSMDFVLTALKVMGQQLK